MDESAATRDSTYVDVGKAFQVLRERKWIIIGLVTLALAISLTLSMLSTPQYSATSKVLLQRNTLDQALFGAQIFQVTDQQRSLKTGADLVKLDQVVEMVRRDLGTSRSAESLNGMVTVDTAGDADIISISAVSPSPVEAADVANSFAHQFILYRLQTDRAILQSARAQVQAQLDAMTPVEQASASGLTLVQKAEELAVLESMQTGGFEMAQAARAPSTAFAPRTYLNAGVALILGLVVGVALAVLLHVADRRMKDEETFQQVFGAPVVASVPVAGRSWSRHKVRRSRAAVGFTDPGSPMLEAFRTLRSNLRFFEVSRSIETILVTSSLPREGKTITSINLALSLAVAGSRVVILEGDLRRPMIQEYLQLDGGAGFSNLLAGTHTIPQVVQTVDTTSLLPPDTTPTLTGSAQDSLVRRNLLCIPAGPMPPNPAELLASQRASDVISEVASLCDYVIIDGPPLLLVSDALELAKKVSGVLVVGRAGSTTIEDARKVRESLLKIGVAPLGVVVAGAVKRKAYHRQYGAYYARRT